MKKVANLMLSSKSNQQACDYILSNFIVGNIPATMMKLLHTPGQLSGVRRAITEIAPKYLICQTKYFALKPYLERKALCRLAHTDSFPY